MVALLLADKLQWLRDWWFELTTRERISATALVLIAIGYIAHYVVYSGFFIEDAGITFAFARNLAEGEGLVPYINGERIEGYSNPLWTFLIAGFHLLGVSPWTSSKLLGAVFGVLTLPLVYGIAKRCRPGKDDFVALFPPALLAAHSVFVIWNASGLENSLFNVLLAAGLWRVLVESEPVAGDGAARRPWSAVFFLGLAITRPEGLLYAAVGGFFRLVMAVTRRQSLAPIVKWLAVFWGPFLTYHAWRFQYFGWEWPNTYYAKLDGENRFQPFKWNAKGWLYAGNYSRAYFLAYALPLYAVGLVGLRSRWRRWVVLTLTVIGAVLLFWNGKDGFPMTDRPSWWADVITQWDMARTWFVVAAAVLLAAGTTIGPGGLTRLMVTVVGCSAFFFVIYSGGDWMKQWRWFNLVSLPNFIVLGLGIGAFADAFPRWLKAIPVRGVVAFVLLVALGAPNIWNSIHAAPHPETTVSDIHRRVKYMSWVQRRMHLDHVTLLDVDMGGHMWYTDWQIADIAGLIDIPMARHLYQRDFIREYIFEERVPQFAHVHGGWANKSKINTHPEWKRNYIELPGYPIGGRSLHVGNHIRKDIFVQSEYDGPKSRETRYEGGLTLQGWDMPANIVPQAGKVYIDTWLRSGFRKSSFRMMVILDDGDGHRITTALAPGYDWYLPKQWKSHETVRGRYDFPLPESLPEGTYDVGFVFLDEKTGLPMEPRDMKEDAPVRYMRGEVWYEDALIVASRQVATDEALADYERALALAASGDCDSSWGAFREARWHIYRNRAWHDQHEEAVEDAVAGCYGRQAGELKDRDAKVAALVEGRKYDHHNDDLKSVAYPLAEALDVDGDAAAAEKDWEAAYAAYRDALRIDPRLSQTRRKAEEARDKRLGIEGKVRDKPRARKKKEDEDERKAREKEKRERSEKLENSEKPDERSDERSSKAKALESFKKSPTPKESDKDDPSIIDPDEARE